MSNIINECIGLFEKEHPDRKIYSIGLVGNKYILSTYVESGSCDDGFYSYDPIKKKIEEYPWMSKINEFKSAMNNIVYKEE